MKTNRKVVTERTHEGAPAVSVSAEAQLRRTVMTSLLWESNFYEDGQSVADRVATLVPLIDPIKVQGMAIEARTLQRLRHMPLLLCRELAYGHALDAETLAAVIQRPDEMGEFLSLYWGGSDRRKSVHRTLTNQTKRGLRLAFPKFDAYQLAKWDKAKAGISLAQVLRLVHPTPADDVQAALWKQVKEGTLAPPDTWEVALLRGEEKGATFTRLLTENRLPYMAMLQNLRNMRDAGVEMSLVGDALQKGAAAAKALPFRYVAAARAVPQWEPILDVAMQTALGAMDKLPGKTVLLVDVSGSMEWKLSDRSELRRVDAAAALAAMLAGVCERFEVYGFSQQLFTIPSRQGFGLIDAITRLVGGGTAMGAAVGYINAHLPYDRLVVITDEQSSDRVPDPAGRGYCINVANAEHGVTYRKWVHIDGWSEACVRFVQEYEKG